MSDLASYADALGVDSSGAPPTQRPAGLSAYADALGISAPKKPRQPADNAGGEPRFTFDDAAQARAQLVAANRPDLVAAFDKQYSTVAPQQARQTAPGQQSDIPVPMAERGPQTPGPAEIPWWKRPAAMVEGALKTGIGGVVGYGAGLANAAPVVARQIGAMATGGDPRQAGSVEQAFNAGNDAVQQAIASKGTPESNQYAEQIGNTIGPSIPALGAVSGSLPGSGMAARTSMDVARAKFATDQAAAAAPKIDPTFAKPRYGVVNGKITRIDQGAPTAAPVAANAAAPTITPTAEMPRGAARPPEQQATVQADFKALGIPLTDQAALQGDAFTRATRYQMGKFDEPAGIASQQQFAGEKAAMSNYVGKMIADTGDSVGMDQSTVTQRGATLAAPTDAFKTWLETQKQHLYAAADAQAGGVPMPGTPKLDALLNDREFGNTAAAMDKDKLVKAAADQLQAFKDRNGGEFTVKTAEDYRKWLNQVWQKEPGIVEKMKGALDEDVFSNAGGPIYDKARQMHATQQRVFGDMKGISNIIDYDPTGNAPRSTALDAMPSKILSLPPAELQRYLKTLDNLPPEMQPQVAAAKGALKSHLYNQMLENSSETRGGNERPFWYSTGVNKVVKANNERMNVLLTPQERAQVDLVKRGGDALSFDPSYPGAAAQASNAAKAGLMSQAIGRGLTGGAAGVGGALFGAPGAVGGALAGNAVAGKMNEAAALRKFKSNQVNLQDVGK